MVSRKTSIVEHAKLQLKRFLLAHLGERFGRKDLIEALGSMMPLPRQRNLDEALAELGEDAAVKVVFAGREKFYSWQEDSTDNADKFELDWALDPKADPLEIANQLEEIGREAMKMARRATVKEDV